MEVSEGPAVLGLWEEIPIKGLTSFSCLLFGGGPHAGSKGRFCCMYELFLHDSKAKRGTLQVV